VQHYLSDFPTVLSVPVGGAQEAGDQQAWQLGGVRCVQGLQRPVGGHPVCAGVLCERPAAGSGRRQHVSAVAGTGRVQATTA